ncbi:hypothetical protein LEMLEM_LOCUS9299, partial [Lemmus lemmus]
QPRGTADERQHQGQLLGCSPRSLRQQRARGPQRALPSRLARAPSPPARAPRPGLGWSRACSSQGGSWASRAVAATRSWQGLSPGKHLPPLGPPGTSQRSPYQSGPSRHHRPWPGLHLRLLSVPGTEGRPPCHVCPSPPPAGAAWFPWFKAIGIWGMFRSLWVSSLGPQGSSTAPVSKHTLSGHGIWIPEMQLLQDFA